VRLLNAIEVPWQPASPPELTIGPGICEPPVPPAAPSPPRRQGEGPGPGWDLVATVAIMAVPVLCGWARELTPGRAMRSVLRYAVPVASLPVPVVEESPGPGHDATGASDRTHHDGRSGRLLC
jgi:hypothetical protein